MVDNLTFDDGEPITNNKLQSLYNAIKILEGNVAKTSIVNTTDNTTKIPLVYAGKFNVDLKSTWNPVQVDFGGFNFSSNNVFVTVTPANVSGSMKVGSIDYHVSTVTSSGFRFYAASAANAGKQIYFYYTAVEMKQSS